MSLSPPDIKGAMNGFGAIVGLFLLISVGTLLVKGEINTAWVASLTKSFSIIYAVMLVAIVFNMLVLGPLVILRKIFK